MKYPIYYNLKGGTGGCKIVVEIYEYLIEGCNTTNQRKYMLKGIDDKIGKINAHYIQEGGIYCNDIISDAISDLPKNTDLQFNESLPYSSKLSYFYNMYLTHEVRKRENFNNFWEKDSNISYFLRLLEAIIPLKDIKGNRVFIPNNRTYIKIIRPEVNTKIVVFGDIHGSFHTFLRLIFRLHRLGVLNLETFKLNKNYKIIFLGDVIDRGNYSLEILFIILFLLTENPENVIFNRGNHEEIEINRANGLWDEISKKTSFDKVDKIFDAINTFLVKNSSAVFIKHDENNKLFLSHGGFSKHSLNSYKRLNTTKKNYILLKDYAYSELRNFKHYTGTFTRWSDFTNDITCMNRGFQTDSCIEIADLRQFIKTTGVNILIRGHQDSLSNNYLFSNEISNTNLYTCAGTILSQNKDKLGKAIVYNNIDSYNGANGCICRVDVSKFNNATYKTEKKLNVNGHEEILELYNVLTTSTNTDINRMLCRDSFVIICFNITNINDFSTSLGNNITNLKSFPAGIKN